MALLAEPSIPMVFVSLCVALKFGSCITVVQSVVSVPSR